MDTLDLDSIQDIMLVLYDQMCSTSHMEHQEQITQIAYGYYHLIRRYQDIEDDCDLKGWFIEHHTLLYLL